MLLTAGDFCPAQCSIRTAYAATATITVSRSFFIVMLPTWNAGLDYFFSAGGVLGAGDTGGVVAAAVAGVGVTVTDPGVPTAAGVGVTVTDAGVPAAGIAVAVTDPCAAAAGVGVTVTDPGIPPAGGASCQWPCSTDQTFPGGGSPGG